MAAFSRKHTGPLIMLRFAATLLRTGESRSAWYRKIVEGTVPLPVKNGKSSTYPDYEIDALVAARIAGKSNDEIKDLVSRMHAARGQALEALGHDDHYRRRGSNRRLQQ